jgi:phosphoenolpyruvate carboxykinase (ATP)
MPLHPTVYAELLAEKIREHNANVWLVNTGWTGGPYGTGHRMKLSHTRKMLDEALKGNLDSVEYSEEPVFGLSIPTDVPGVPSEILNPRNTWSDKEAYDKKADQLADMFNENFKQFKKQAANEILEAGPV